jgi:DNA-binding NarL/FixJ family response regulator
MALAGAARMGQVITRRAILLHEALRAGAPAAQVVRGLQQLAARCDSPRVAACAEHAAASARRDGEALEHAAERFEQIGAVLHAAEVRAEAAAAHAANGNRPRAVAAAETSRRLANHCQGAWTPTLKLADAAINNLTPREAQVAALATRGLTNAQIAERLTLSTRTIDSHLQRIYTKLGINRRERLTEILTLD